MQSIRAASSSLLVFITLGLCACGGGGGGANFTPLDISARGAPEEPQKAAGTATVTAAPPEGEDSAMTAEKFESRAAAAQTEQLKGSYDGRSKASNPVKASPESRSTLATAPGLRTQER